MPEREPAVVVVSSLFPHGGNPGAGLFVRERMFRVARHLPLTVIAPQPWFPLQGLLRKLRPHFRPAAPTMELQQGVEVYCPRFLSFPGVLKWLDGPAMSWSLRRLLRRLKAEGRADILDAHFAYPDGYAAVAAGKRFGLPVTITLRGTEPRTAGYAWRGRQQRQAMRQATKVFAVADSLRQLALREGVLEDRTRVFGNGVDTERFQPIDRQAARQALGLPDDATVLITVGGLVERKGFHRVIELLPELQGAFPNLHYLLVGGASAEGDWTDRLRAQVAELGLGERVRMLGKRPPDELSALYSAADLFVLSTRNEGWANVFLEAMACGLPVVTTDVGGNREVVANDDLGLVVPFGDRAALRDAILTALRQDWDRDAILRYAQDNAWNIKIPQLVQELETLALSSAP